VAASYYGVDSATGGSSFISGHGSCAFGPSGLDLIHRAPSLYIQSVADVCCSHSCLLPFISLPFSINVRSFRFPRSLSPRVESNFAQINLPI
jgi:hypothetical protein